MTPFKRPGSRSLSRMARTSSSGQRLEVEAVGGVVVGRHRLRVAVDHDGLVAGLAQRETGVAAAIVELDALADAVRAAAEDDDLVLSVGRALVGQRAGAERCRIGRVHVGGRRGELGRAGVDPLEHGGDAECLAQCRDLVGAPAGQRSKTRVRETGGLEGMRSGAGRPPVGRSGFTFASRSTISCSRSMNQWIDPAGLVDHRHGSCRAAAPGRR